MKTKIALFVCFLTGILLLAGCNNNKAAQNFTNVVGDYNPAFHEKKTGGPAEVSFLDKPDFTADIGFKLISWPDTQDLAPYKYFAINKRFGQVEFKTPDGRTMVMRVARNTAGAITDTYQETHLLQRETLQINGVDVTVGKSSDGCSLIKWKRGGYQYIVHSNASHGVPKEEEIKLLVTELDAEESAVSSK